MPIGPRKAEHTVSKSTRTASGARRSSRCAGRRRQPSAVVGSTVVAVCVVVAARHRRRRRLKIYQTTRRRTSSRNTDLTDIGAAAKAAGCTAVQEEDATGAGQHMTTPVTYRRHPPSFGPHNPTPDRRGNHIYTADDRPPVEVLVHNLEHGWTIVWYDETIADDAEQMKVLKATADKFDAHGSDPNVQHDHRAVDQGRRRRPDPRRQAHRVHALVDPPADVRPRGVRRRGDIPSFGESQYCDTFSGEALDDFMKKYPYDDAPEGYLWHQ